MDRRTPPHRHTPPYNRPSHTAAAVEEKLKQGEISLAARIQMMQETMQQIERNNENYRPRDRSSSPDLKVRTEEHRSTGARVIGDPRIHRISVFNLEQLRNPQVDQYPTRNRDDVHREQPIAATPLEMRLDHVKVMMSQLLKSAQDLVEDMKTENNRRRDRSSSRDHPRYEVHQPNSVLNQVIQEAPLLASPLIKQLETKSPEIIAPAPIVQDSVRRSEVVEEVWVQQVQELQDLVADQVFDEIPQPTIQAVDDESEGTKSQKSEEVSFHQAQELPGQATPKNSTESALQLNHLSDILEIQHVQKIKELKIQFLINDDGLEASSGVKELQNYVLDFPDGISPTFSFSAKMGNEDPQMSFSSSSSLVADSSRISFSGPSDSKLGNSSSISVALGVTQSPLTAGPESQKRDSKNSFKADAFNSPETVPSAVPTPSPSTFQFGSSSSLNNGSVNPPFLFAAPPAATDSAKATSTGNTTDNNFSPASSTPSSVAATVSSVFPSTSASPSSAATAVGLTEAKTNETNFGNLTGSSFGGTSSGVGASGGFQFGASTGTLSTIFGGTAGSSSSSASTESNIFGGSSGPSSTSASIESNIFGGSSGPSSTSAALGTNLFGGTSALTTPGSNVFGGTVMSSESKTLAGTGMPTFGGTSALTTLGSNVFGGTAISSESKNLAGTGMPTFGGTSSVASTGSGFFNFNTGAAASSAASNQSQAFNPFSNDSAPTLKAESVSATSTQSIPIQFGSSAPAPSSGLTGNTAFSSSSPFFGSSSSTTKPFSAGVTFGLTPFTPSSEASAPSSSNNNTSSVFGSSWQTTKFPVPNSTTSAPPVFAFGGSSSSTNISNTTPTFFGSSAGNTSTSFPPFSSPAIATPSQPVFGSSSPASPFGNNGQMSMEDSMAEDPVQTNAPSVPVFNQQPMSSGFVFGAPSAPVGGNPFGATPPAANPFQFGGQPSIAATPQNTSPFQASGSLEFNAGGSFSLGSGGGDKANRRIVRVKKTLKRR